MYIWRIVILKNEVIRTFVKIIQLDVLQVDSVEGKKFKHSLQVRVFAETELIVEWRRSQFPVGL